MIQKISQRIDNTSAKLKRTWEAIRDAAREYYRGPLQENNKPEFVQEITKRLPPSIHQTTRVPLTNFKGGLIAIDKSGTFDTLKKSLDTSAYPLRRLLGELHPKAGIFITQGTPPLVETEHPHFLRIQLFPRSTLPLLEQLSLILLWKQEAERLQLIQELVSGIKETFVNEIFSLLQTIQGDATPKEIQEKFEAFKALWQKTASPGNTSGIYFQPTLGLTYLIELRHTFGGIDPLPTTRIREEVPSHFIFYSPESLPEGASDICKVLEKAVGKNGWMQALEPMLDKEVKKRAGAIATLLNQEKEKTSRDLDTVFEALLLATETAKRLAPAQNPKNRQTLLDILRFALTHPNPFLSEQITLIAESPSAKK